MVCGAACTGFDVAQFIYKSEHMFVIQARAVEAIHVKVSVAHASQAGRLATATAVFSSQFSVRSPGRWRCSLKTRNWFLPLPFSAALRGPPRTKGVAVAVRQANASGAKRGSTIIEYPLLALSTWVVMSCTGKLGRLVDKRNVPRIVPGVGYFPAFPEICQWNALTIWQLRS